MLNTSGPEMMMDMMATNTWPNQDASGRTSFNKVALEDTFIWGLSQPILSKVYSQTSSLSSLDNWKTVLCNVCHLHREFAKLKQSICPIQMQSLSDAAPWHHPHSRHPLTHGH